MTRRVLGVNPDDPREDRIRPALDILEHGGIIALPTETFYALGADCTCTAALERINGLKRKSAGAPILVLASDVAQVRRFSGALPAVFETLAATFWPGPLTLVVPAGDELPPEVSGGRGTVGIRVPGLVLPRRLAALSGRPITGVSANLTGQPPFRTAAAVLETFGEGIQMVLDGGPALGGAPSTVLDLSTEVPTILRRGTLPVQSLRPFLPGLVEESSLHR